MKLTAVTSLKTSKGAIRVWQQKLLENELKEVAAHTSYYQNLNRRYPFFPYIFQKA